LDVAVRCSAVSQKEKDKEKERLAIAMMDMMEKIEGLERENKAISDKARVDTGRITDTYA
jgi:hypothetical protein